MEHTEGLGISFLLLLGAELVESALLGVALGVHGLLDQLDLLLLPVVLLGLSRLLLHHEQLLLVLALAAFASYFFTSVVLLLLQTDTLLHVVLDLLGQFLLLPSQLRKDCCLLFVVYSRGQLFDGYGFFKVYVSVSLLLFLNKRIQVFS